MKETKTYIWQESDAKERLDKVLAQRLELSRTQLQTWIEKDLVQRAGKPINVKTRMFTDDEITISIPAAEVWHIKPEDRPLDILFEDEYFMVINKAAGEVVHPGAGHLEGTIVSAILHHCKGKLSGVGGVERPGIVHRLDKDTSGVLIIAKDDETHQFLSKQFQLRKTVKIYRALVLSAPKIQHGSWLGNIGRHANHRQKMTVLKGSGRTAHTDYKVLKRFGEIASELELNIHTGRTHQIRVHCQHVGCPVVGDTLYGRRQRWFEEAGVKRQMLHAQSLTIQHPKTKKKMTFTAPLPEDFISVEKFIKKLTATK
jgi:23S rRNA pseudouridine1911/1915/1917 synthase